VAQKNGGLKAMQETNEKKANDIRSHWLHIPISLLEN
jgi:hypothetical protein